MLAELSIGNVHHSHYYILSYIFQGDYEIIIHLAEVFFSDPGKRVFDLYVEGEVFYNIDVVALGGGKAKAFTIEVAKIVDDGFVSIKGINKVNNAKISGIEIILQEVHTAHAVAQGPYVVIDKDDDGFGVIPVDSSKSHPFVCTLDQACTTQLPLVALTPLIIAFFSCSSKPHTWPWVVPH